MGMNVLLLDSSFYPIRIIDWKRAMILFFGGRAQVIEEHETVQINSPTKSFPLPKVLRLLTNFSHTNNVKFNRDNIFIRDNFKCQYCSKSFKKSELTLDHIIPKSRGGGTSWENITTSCGKCNNVKADRTPKEAKMPLLSKPSQPTHLMMLMRRVKSKEQGFAHWFFT